MLSSGLRAAALALGVATAATAAPAPAAAPALARLSYVERQVELGGAGAWRAAREGHTLRIGEQLRTSSDAGLHVDFSWMSLSVSPGTELQFPDSQLLHGRLASGRVALHADRREILKLVTDAAEIRGRGRVVVRRQGQETFVSALAGLFSVDGGGQAINVGAGTGTIVTAGQPPSAATGLPQPPEVLEPGDDPVYVRPKETVRLRWSGRGGAYHVEILAVGSETVLMERNVTASELEVSIPWPGAFRWRVASRDARGLEGPPSRDGLICVDE